MQGRGHDSTFELRASEVTLQVLADSTVSTYNNNNNNNTRFI